jgi:M6 family metalloprotease-like protein
MICTNKTILLTLAFFIISTISVFSAWFDDVPGEVVQPDGTKLSVFFTGDEFFVRIHDDNKFTMIRDPKTGYWCWAKQEKGDLVSTGYPVHQHSAISLGLTQGIAISVERYFDIKREFESYLDDRPSRAPTTGVVNNIVIYIRFSDDTPFTTPYSFYEQMFNATGENIDSKKQYFLDASYGQLTVDSHFFPISTTDVILSYQSPLPRAHFQPFHPIMNPQGYDQNDFWARAQREHLLLANAVNSVSHQIPTTLNLDANGDGFVDNICFIIRGETSDWATLLWPHRWVLFSQLVYINGIAVYDYNFNLEYFTSNSGVSVLAHEFVHTMGAPDYYRYGYDGMPVGKWELMASNTVPAQSLSAYTKWYYLNWTLAPTTIMTSGTYTLQPITTSRFNHTYRINSPHSTTEYFLVEYRCNQTGLTDSTLPGSGLLVYRVNPLAEGGSAAPPDRLYIYRPFGSPHFEGILDEALFSQEYERAAMNSFTNPYPFLSNGNAGGLNLSNIFVEDGILSFDVSINTATVLNPPQSLTISTASSDPILNWAIPSGSLTSLTGYNVYSGSEFLDFVPTPTRTFTDWDISIGFHTYHVTAVYTSGESEPVSRQIYFGHYTISNFPYRYEFEDHMLLGWSRANGVLGTNSTLTPFTNPHWISLQHWRLGNFAGRGSHPNRQAIRLNMRETQDFWLISPIIELPENTENFVLEFDIAHIPDSGSGDAIAGPNDFIAVVVSENGGVSWSNANVIARWDNQSSERVLNDVARDGETIVLSLEDYTGSIKIGFYGKSVLDGSNTLFYVDNFTIRSAVSIPRVRDLSATVDGDVVTLTWLEPLEATGNVENISYRISRGSTFLIETEELTYIDSEVPNGTHTYFVIRKVDGELSLPATVSAVVNVVSDSDETIPSIGFALQGNYPNPFNPETVIWFTVGSEQRIANSEQLIACHQKVSIDIYNIRGQKVRTLANDYFASGSHSVVWDGRDESGREVSSGLYFYRMTSGDFVQTRKMILMK